MNDTQIEQYGDELYQALLDRQPVAPLTEREPSLAKGHFGALGGVTLPALVP